VVQRTPVKFIRVRDHIKLTEAIVGDPSRFAADRVFFHRSIRKDIQGRLPVIAKIELVKIELDPNIMSDSAFPAKG
jgi:hypothetical protein